MYLYCNIGMYNNTMLSYSDYCTVLILSVYMYGYSTRRIYVTVTFPYVIERGVTEIFGSLQPLKILILKVDLLLAT